MSKRIALCTVKDESPWNSYFEGEFSGHGGLLAAIKNAQLNAAERRPYDPGCDGIGVMVSAVGDGPSRLVCWFPYATYSTTERPAKL